MISGLAKSPRIASSKCEVEKVSIILLGLLLYNIKTPDFVKLTELLRKGLFLVATKRG